MRACDQSSIFSTGGKFCLDYGLLLELHALTLVTRSYALLILYISLVALLHTNFQTWCLRTGEPREKAITPIQERRERGRGLVVSSPFLLVLCFLSL